MAASAELPAQLKDQVQAAYRHYLEAKGYRPRYGQRLMIAEIVKGLVGGDESVVVVEAGTGTGKTVAYLLAALPTAKHFKKRLVLSTATVALQDQIIGKDLPDLAAHSGLEFTYALAKGRSRYLCLSKLDQLLSQDQQQEGLALYDDELALRLDGEQTRLLEELADAYVGGRWDGDRDSWRDEIAQENWQLLTTDHRQCSNRRCAHFSGCCFFKARESLDQADCIVANHDLVLADLALGGGAVLPDPEDTFYVFDEGHHLADKAVQHFSHRLRLRSSRSWLKQLSKTLARLAKDLPQAEALLRYYPPVTESIASAEELLPELLVLLEPLLPLEEDDREPVVQHSRFANGVVPEPISAQCARLRQPLRRVAVQLDSMVEVLKEALSEPLHGISRELAERWYPVLGRALSRAEAAYGLLQDYAEPAHRGTVPQARWLSRYPFQQGDDVELCSSPILAAETLQESLWNRCHGAVVTSATLTALGRFDHFQLCSGVPAGTRFASVPSPFDYASNGVLRLPRLEADPGHPEEHDRVVAEALDAFLDPKKGALVLFTSWRQLNRVRDRLGDVWRSRILAQGDLGKQEILKSHRQRIDSGQGSVIFGLASFAEGIDLPGDYLTQVVIAKIPFAVPGDPVESALHEWVREQGQDPFSAISVPLASVRLIQACGRLIRSESDSGEVMILDNRLKTRRYGRDLLAALPPFRVVAE
ncbi:ATP-dependent DNA helicase DinG [Motiliproteus sediminis]|uniref:ATP-dependent DNA helicase DinG n=1 Tax=Motiliproteus sediminis TaxID=1468178 RepID=UPI001AEF9AA3|nr:ATP-dependent DNA helicase DinG [Motiliproteus sediminis]